MDRVPAALMPVPSWSRAPHVLATALALVALTLSAGACSKGRTLHGAEASTTSVAVKVVSAFNSHDVAALEAVALTEGEFREVVWPRLPAARPERNLSWDYVWNDLSSKSRLHLRARMEAWQSLRYEVEGVRFEGESTDYGSYRVHRDARVQLRTPDGRQMSARLFGSMIERDGRFKVFSYIVD
jgi:hypothetical protein